MNTNRQTSATALALVALVVALLALAGVPALAPVGATRSATGEKGPGVTMGVDGGPSLDEPTIVPEQPRGARAATAQFQVNYASSVTPEAQAAFQRAVDIWAGMITSPVPIVVDVKLGTFPGNAQRLAEAKFVDTYRNFPNAPLADTWYPVPIANALAGQDQDPGSVDIEATFLENYADWYYGSGTTPTDKYSFTAFALHELGHGLGIGGTAKYANGVGSWGGGLGFPFVYDTAVDNGAGQQLITAYPNNSTALGSQYTGNALYFNGTNAIAANGGTPPRLHAPTTWIDGTSYVHLDEATYPPGDPNSLMTPLLNKGEAIYDPGAIARGLLADMGWATNAPGASPTPSPTASPSPSGSPAPTGTFVDVPPSYWAYSQINAFAQRGITTGCDTDAQGNKYYCPERGVTRAEMAAFLTRTLGQDKATPPATATFADVPTGYWAYGQIEAFLKLGITTGCGTDAQGRKLFCPERGVTRAEMAAFLDRAKGQTELKSATPTFADVPTSYWAYGWIERFFTLSITTGCGQDAQGRKVYCPDRGVTRAEMAVFIIRAYP